jgi:hypothetical protein
MRCEKCNRELDKDKVEVGLTVNAEGVTTAASSYNVCSCNHFNNLGYWKVRDSYDLCFTKIDIPREEFNKI